ncbi:hypothetical protein BAUCODRAFT_23503 [Baudoinia panamericana UAMH 10762]|uniref:RAD52 homolog n=1 Tax=Baudoinia panamericana (strain UAMH 10762) TaxID=717646 RepID=M2LRP7_BAUPA|nr:uncharacterized protein BAUCODRAFT_23503 [Baudoinia panamericana UAMH 10762]EMC97132.1 hypothetical protein BAUCODRAFT_23503 [Baudoinia panamericana UAMH 10762]
MPLPGDQHRDTLATTNPFADHKPHISEFTAQEIATLQSRLDKQLGPEYISTRPGAGGGKLHYLAADKVINLANEVFGFNGWSSAIQNVQIDFVDENTESGKISLGLSTIVRVTLRDGTFHEDIGYGHIENCKGKAAAFEKAKKEAATDALKRALRNFGNVLGNCLYDKDYLQKVTKLKVAPSKWDADNLHRHPDFAPIKKESLAQVEAQPTNAVGPVRQSSVKSGLSVNSAEFDDDFGGSGLEDVDFSHPDGVILDDSTIAGPGTPAQKAMGVPQHPGHRQGVPRMHSMPHLRPPNVQPPQPVQNLQAPQRPPGVARPPTNAAQAPPNRMPPPPAQQPGPMEKPQPPNAPIASGVQRPPLAPPQSAGPMQNHSDNLGVRSNPSSATTVADSPSDVLAEREASKQANGNNIVSNVDGQHMDDQQMPIPRSPPPGFPEGFVTGRSADLLNQPSEARPVVGHAMAFNPHADSPSIRRTHGVNPGRSAPVARQALSGQANGQQGHASSAGNGMNGAVTPIRTNFVNPSADLHRRIGAPAPPGGMTNRGAYRPPTAVGVKRPPLADVSNLAQNQVDGAGDGETMAKKLKVESAPVVTNEAARAAIT